MRKLTNLFEWYEVHNVLWLSVVDKFCFLNFGSIQGVTDFVNLNNVKRLGRGFTF